MVTQRRKWYTDGGKTQWKLQIKNLGDFTNLTLWVSGTHQILSKQRQVRINLSLTNIILFSLKDLLYITMCHQRYIYIKNTWLFIKKPISWISTENCVFSFLMSNYLLPTCNFNRRSGFLHALWSLVVFCELAVVPK